jgi:glycosyltransferase involved in cell wall biosynthesis
LPAAAPSPEFIASAGGPPEVSAPPRKRIGVLVVAYNAIATLTRTLERIPADLMARLDGLFVFDDHSTDQTYEAALAYRESQHFGKLDVFHNERNLRYGGNQKRGFRYAIDRGYDIVVLLHGDGQYAPEVMERVIAPVERGEVDLVMGSRMMPGGHPLKGGMPLYKYVGNRVLTAMENALLGTRLFEFHSGYRAYNCHALAELPFEQLSNEWHFDTEIIIQLLARGHRVAETPIPTYYGDEICRVNGIPYAFNCVAAAVKYRLHRAGLRRAEAFDFGR